MLGPQLPCFGSSPGGGAYTKLDGRRGLACWVSAAASPRGSLALYFPALDPLAAQGRGIPTRSDKVGFRPLLQNGSPDRRRHGGWQAPREQWRAVPRKQPIPPTKPIHLVWGIDLSGVQKSGWPTAGVGGMEWEWSGVTEGGKHSLVAG